MFFEKIGKNYHKIKLDVGKTLILDRIGTAYRDLTTAHILHIHAVFAVLIQLKHVTCYST
jgi:hypothetical protein